MYNEFNYKQAERLTNGLTSLNKKVNYLSNLFEVEQRELIEFLIHKSDMLNDVYELEEKLKCLKQDLLYKVNELAERAKRPTYNEVRAIEANDY